MNAIDPAPAADASADPLAWLGEPGAAIAELAFGRARTSAEGGLVTTRHLALLPVDSLDLDLGDAQQRQFGDYELLELIGEGGMGVVYRARQGSLDREVAVKLLAAGPWASREFVERFRREAQNAARMQHPNIVAIYEVGSAEELHFFSMRLVRGESLAATIRREGPFDPQRAASLMRTVAEALAYAHSLGVLHLDLKPANILLDENGEPHVADFGLARRLDSTLALDNEEVSGTPAYMAPEQALARVQKITASTDIWGLGAILYELVTGELPFRGHDAQSTLKLVIEGDLRRPRAVATTLPLDLEAIILQCMARDPVERYPSARALADDLGRFTDRRAVRARPLNAFERIGRWVRREPRMAAASTLVVLSLIVGLVATTQQWRRAERNAARTEAVRQFLVGVFEKASPDENGGKPFTAHQLLEKGEKQLADHPPRDAAVEADITALLGRLYIDVSDFERSGTLLDRAFGMVGGHAIPDDIRGRVLLGKALIEDENGNYNDAILHAQQSVKLLERIEPRNAGDIANAHLAIAHALFGSGDKRGTEEYLRTVLPFDGAALGDRNPLMADMWVQLGNVLGSIGRFDESDAAFKKALAISAAAAGERSNGVAHVLNEYSNMLEDKGEWPAAEKALREALAIRLETIGPDRHDTIAVQSNLLWLLEFEGRYEEALPQRLDLIERATRGGQLHPQDRAAVLASLGKDYRELGRFDEAIATLREAVDLGVSTAGKDGAINPLHLRQLGNSQMLAGDYDAADKSLADALSSLKQHDPATSPTLNAITADIGNLLRLRHRPAEAITALKAANEALASTVKETDTSRPLAMAQLAEAQLDAGDAATAATTAADSLAHARLAFAARQYQLGTPLFALARAKLALGAPAEAEPLLREALAVRHPPHPLDDPRILEVNVAQVQALEALGRKEEASVLRAGTQALLAKLTTPYAADLRARLANEHPR